MRIFRRAFSAVGLSLSLACSGTVTSAAELSYYSAGWSDPVAVPSVTAVEPALGIGLVKPAGVAQPISPVVEPDNAILADTPYTANDADDVEYVTYQPASVWTASVGALFLKRSHPGPAVIATTNPAPGTLVDASDFSFKFVGGIDVALSRQSANGLIWDTRYFNNGSSDSTTTIPGVTTFRTAGIGVTILGGGTLTNIYQSQIQSTEVNVGKQWNGISFLTGFRAVEFHDRFRQDISSPGIADIWNETNRLYGGQVGVNMATFSPASRLQFNTIAKAGLYGNTANTHFTSQIVSGANSSAMAAAFVGDLQFTATYQLTQRLSLRGGYQLLWVDNVALAGMVASSTQQVAGGTSSPTRTTGDVWYNGATAALVYSW